MDKIAGVVLAGGQSSRMGKNKALLLFQGVPMVEHMKKILAEAGIQDIYISGTVAGYESIPDEEPLLGPGRAIAHMLQKFAKRYERLIFIPVDMPFMSKDVLWKLLSGEGNVFMKGHPLPACLLTRDDLLKANSVKGILEETAARPLEMDGFAEKHFSNINTPEEWEKATRG